MAFHEHAARDEEEVDVFGDRLCVRVVVLHAVVAVLEICVCVVVLGEQADGEVLVRVGGVLPERLEGRAAFEQEQRVELDDREHEEGEGWCVFLLGAARRGLVSDRFVLQYEAVRHGVRELLGRESDVVFEQWQVAVAVVLVRVCRRDGMELGRFAAHAQGEHESVLPREARDFLPCCTLGEGTRDVHDVLCGDEPSEFEDGKRKAGVGKGVRCLFRGVREDGIPEVLDIREDVRHGFRGVREEVALLAAVRQAVCLEELLVQGQLRAVTRFGLRLVVSMKQCSPSE